MNEKQFVKELENKQGEVVHQFKNEFKEKFFIYKFKEVGAYFVTGDEFDWEFGWMLQKGDHKEAIQLFQFSMEEGSELMKFWNESFKQEQEMFESAHKARKHGVAGLQRNNEKNEKPKR